MTGSNSVSRKEYVEAAKAAFLKLGKEQAIKVLSKKLIAAGFGFLLAGPFATILPWVVDHVLVAAIEEGDTGIFFVYIDFRVGSQERDFSDAAMNYYRVQQNGTEAEKHEAEEKLIVAFDDFIKFTSY